MEINKGLKKLLVCSIALASLSSVGLSGMNNVNASHAHARVTKVANSKVNSIYNKMLNKAEDYFNNPHVNKNLKHQFMKILPKLSKEQVYEFGYVQGQDFLLNKRDRAIFNKVYNREINGHINKNAKFNSQHIYNVIANNDGNDMITGQVKYDFLKMLPTLSYQQVSNLYNGEGGQRDTLIQNYGSKVGNAIINRYNALNGNFTNKQSQAESNKMTALAKAVIKNEFKDVNAVRKAHHLKPLKHSNELQMIANASVKNLKQAKNKKYALAVNAGKLGFTSIDADLNGNLIPYSVNNSATAKGIAKQDVDTMVGATGYSSNVLSKHEHKLAVGVQYNQANHKMTVLELFL